LCEEAKILYFEPTFEWVRISKAGSNEKIQYFFLNNWVHMSLPRPVQ
jgi:hypothetical protein